MINITKIRKIASILGSALENEYSLDVRFRELTPIKDFSIPNYKIMKQHALKARLGIIYPLVLKLSPWLVVLIQPIFWLLALLSSLFKISRDAKSEGFRCFLTTVQAEELIRSALFEKSSFLSNISLYPSGYFGAGNLIGIKAVIESIAVNILLLINIHRIVPEVRRDMVLHARDSFYLSMLAVYAYSSNEIFITNDHYQRWAYVLSHTAKYFRIVQHGFLDEGLILPNSGGEVSCVYVRDPIFRASFDRYYSVTEYQLFSPSSGFVITPLSDHALFLASSFPSIDYEIGLLNIIRISCPDLPIIVKFHPNHLYDSRRKILADCSDLVFEDSGNPACRIFVSYRSFMEFDYRSQCIPTVSIVRCGCVEVAVEEIISAINNFDSFKAKRP